ncbi:hypothetical protein QJQ45_016004 [Haematococcus lacustris]|nr:hypothetical protein QJQ45_016004 [Haematococcus lacustris]
MLTCTCAGSWHHYNSCVRSSLHIQTRTQFFNRCLGPSAYQTALLVSLGQREYLDAIQHALEQLHLDPNYAIGPELTALRRHCWKKSQRQRLVPGAPSFQFGDFEPEPLSADGDTDCPGLQFEPSSSSGAGAAPAVNGLNNSRRVQPMAQLVKREPRDAPCVSVFPHLALNLKRGLDSGPLEEADSLPPPPPPPMTWMPPCQGQARGPTKHQGRARRLSEGRGPELGNHAQRSHRASSVQRSNSSSHLPGLPPAPQLHSAALSWPTLPGKADAEDRPQPQQVVNLADLLPPWPQPDAGIAAVDVSLSRQLPNCSWPTQPLDLSQLWGLPAATTSLGLTLPPSAAAPVPPLAQTQSAPLAQECEAAEAGARPHGLINLQHSAEALCNLPPAPRNTPPSLPSPPAALPALPGASVGEEGMAAMLNTAILQQQQQLKPDMDAVDGGTAKAAGSRVKALPHCPASRPSSPPTCITTTATILPTLPASLLLSITTPGNKAHEAAVATTSAAPGVLVMGSSLPPVKPDAPPSPAAIAAPEEEAVGLAGQQGRLRELLQQQLEAEWQASAAALKRARELAAALEALGHQPAGEGSGAAPSLSSSQAGAGAGPLPHSSTTVPGMSRSATVVGAEAPPHPTPDTALAAASAQPKPMPLLCLPSTSQRPRPAVSSSASVDQPPPQPLEGDELWGEQEADLPDGPEGAQELVPVEQGTPRLGCPASMDSMWASPQPVALPAATPLCAPDHTGGGCRTRGPSTARGEQEQPTLSHLPGRPPADTPHQGLQASGSQQQQPEVTTAVQANSSHTPSLPRLLPFSPFDPQLADANTLSCHLPKAWDAAGTPFTAWQKAGGRGQRPGGKGSGFLPLWALASPRAAEGVVPVAASPTAPRPQEGGQCDMASIHDWLCTDEPMVDMAMQLHARQQERDLLDAQLRRDRNEFTAQAKLLSHHFQTAQQRTSALQGHSDGLEAELAQAKKLLEQASAEREQLSIQVAEYQAQLASQSEARDELVAMLTGRDEVLAELKLAVEEQRQAARTAQAAKAALQTQLKGMVAAEQELTVNLKATHAQIEEQLHSLRTQLKDERQRRLAVAKKKAELAQQVSLLGSRLAALAAARDVRTPAPDQDLPASPPSSSKTS